MDVAMDEVCRLEAKILGRFGSVLGWIGSDLD